MQADKNRFHQYCLHYSAYQAVNNSIFIIGPGRTGSTLIGRIVQTLKKIKYVYEPCLLHSLIPSIGLIGQNEFKMLFETYLYEDKFLGAVTGRGWNCNIKDESSIYKSKSNAEITKQLSISLTKQVAMRLGRASVLAVKITDTVPFMCQVRSLYPNMRFIVTHRCADSCIESILEKRWFSDITLSNRDIVWNGKYIKGMLHPYWLREEDFNIWAKLSEIERAALYYNTMYASLSSAGAFYLFSYEALQEDPNTAINKLANWLGLERSKETKYVLDALFKNKRKNSAILKKLSAENRLKAIQFSDAEFVASFGK